MEIIPRFLDVLGPITRDNLEAMRSFMADNGKLYLNTENTTINLWPVAIAGVLCLLVLPVLLPTLIHAYLNVYDDYEEGYNLDNNYSEFRKRRRGPGKRSRTTDDYSEDWKNSDYYQYWDKQNRELDSATQNSMAGMVVGLADSV